MILYRQMGKDEVERKQLNDTLSHAGWHSGRHGRNSSSRAMIARYSASATNS